MARLRKADCSGPGIRRRRRGKGFEYLHDSGRKIKDAEVLRRIDELRIPPAWEEVWICPLAHGHLQATGLDAAGRKQYLYHQRWRERRDQQKFDEMIDFARSLPKMRKRVARDLAGDDLRRERVLACAVRLLDRGFFRVGGEDYAEENDTYGIATMRRDHATVSDDVVVFDYESKGGQRQVQSIGDPEVAVVVRTLKRRRSARGELFDARSSDINDY